ncbi:MAG: precorrin-4 C(11)-methyltransferase [Desulfobacteraceae bacterium]|nr:MAG: precorrin-4 C(11)-methyltransferase [Desulfobacteraceae bacterium]
MKHPVIFAGAGPGDPELITVKTQRAIEEADVILFTGSLVPEAVFGRAKPEAERINSASMHLARIVEKMVDGYRAGKRVLRLHTGDPSLYGAIFEQMVELDREAVPYKIIPGVTAAFAAASALGIEYTLPEATQTLILTRMGGKTPVPDSESLASLASHRASMAIYLSIGHIEEVQAVLKEAYGPDAGCAVVCRAGHPDEKVIVTRIESLARRVQAEKITRQAVIIVGKGLEARHGGKGKVAKSKLYDEGFEHGFRSADRAEDPEE